MVVVIGSGPAGVACAAALLARGTQVQMIDAGITLEPLKKAIIEQLQKHWDPATAGQLKHTLDASNPLKLSYGSHYPYDIPSAHTQLQMDDSLECLPSFAQGGLSNVWGAFVERYDNNAIADWPVSAAAFSPYYETVFSMLHPAISSDVANDDAENTYHPSAQAKALFAHWSANRNALNEAQCHFSPAELAVRFGKADAAFCNYNGACQHGCPFDLIYSARHTLQALLQKPNFHYVKDIVVTSIRETQENIIIEGVNHITNAPYHTEASQVFSACGAIISTKLALEAAAYTEKVKFLDSSHFMIPIVMHTRVRNVERERLHTLAQLVIKLRGVAKFPVNLQFYTYMDHYTQRLKQIFGAGYPFLHPLLTPIIDRLIAIQGHLHSSDSHSFSMQLTGDKKVKLASLKNATVNNTMKNLLGFMARHKELLGFIPVPKMARVSKIGKSFHYGGSMPMRQTPSGHETDLLGRPFGYKRWHIVDSTVFPSIPAGSITPTIMANAYRIATECPLL